MPTIIVPTDFSDTTATALKAAAYLAELTGFAIEVVHFHDGYGEKDQFLAIDGNLSAHTTAQRKLTEFIRLKTEAGSFEGIADFSSRGLPNLKLRTLIGDPAKGLLEVSEEENTALIVMGASGAGVAKRSGWFYGSVAKAVTMHGKCPVLMIPKGFEFSDFKSIAYSFRGETQLKAIHEKANFFFKNDTPRICYVHLKHDNPDEERSETEFLYEEGKTDFIEDWAELKLLEPGKLVNRLAEMIEEENTKLLIMGRRKRGLIESIFIDSEIEPLLKRCRIPLLITPIPK